MRVPGEVFLVRHKGCLTFTGNSARHGQKGTIGERRRAVDMPFVSSGPNAGMTPDVIINVCAINGRMTVGMLLEMAYSGLGLAKGSFVDATPFRDMSARSVLQELAASGYGANVSMIDGTSGEPIEGEFFLQPCFYQRLKHMVLDKISKRQRGMYAAQTHQPLGGKSGGEAQRVGPMEAMAFVTHGAAAVIDDALRVRSDNHVVPVCLVCGALVDDASVGLTGTSVPPGTKGAYCRLCKARTPQAALSTTRCNVLWQQEVAALGIKVSADMGVRVARPAPEPEHSIRLDDVHEDAHDAADANDADIFDEDADEDADADADADDGDMVARLDPMHARASASAHIDDDDEEDEDDANAIAIAACAVSAFPEDLSADHDSDPDLDSQVDSNADSDSDSDSDFDSELDARANAEFDARARIGDHAHSEFERSDNAHSEFERSDNAHSDPAHNAPVYSRTQLEGIRAFLRDQGLGSAPASTLAFAPASISAAPAADLEHGTGVLNVTHAGAAQIDKDAQMHTQKRKRVHWSNVNTIDTYEVEE